VVTPLRALRPGDVVGVPAPAGPVEAERLDAGVAELRALGFEVRAANGVLERRGFTAGDGGLRLRQLHELFADPEVRAIVCARGGAGTLHLLPQLDERLLSRCPKPLVGCSDVTALHQVLAHLGIPSLHGPMVAGDLAGGEDRYDRASLWSALTGEGDPWTSPPGSLTALRAGAASGVLRGGCLSLLAALAGTRWGLDTGREDTLLLVEDVNERPYRVDRMLRQLRLAGSFAGVRGVVFGQMPGCDAGAQDGYTLEDVVREALFGLDVPVAWGLATGHTGGGSVTLPLGARAALECRDGEATLRVLEHVVA
jgi:muramoyltetrapeptide carboxypeptidase